ncbi:MAG: right-handed parallel beta-helix repeat-containing protein [Kiritimatiellae bacterium]|nr:right-handed parallel beta-helix repeat-containing protein [Kiritimatiellia bacterium]
MMTRRAEGGVAGSPPNPQGLTVIDQDTAWEGETLILGGETRIGHPEKRITVLWKNCKIAVRGEILVDRYSPGMAPVTFICEDSELEFDCKKDLEYGFRLSRSCPERSGWREGSKVAIRRCRILGAGLDRRGAGLHFEGKEGGDNLTTVQVSETAFRYMGSGGGPGYGGGPMQFVKEIAAVHLGWLFSRNTYTQDSYLTKLDFADCGVCVGGTGLGVTHSTFKDCWVGVLLSEYAAHCSFDNVDYAIYNPAPRAIIEYNRFARCSKYTFDCYPFGRGLVIRDNVLTDCSHNGIILAGSEDCVVERNVLINVKGGGCYVQHAMDGSGKSPNNLFHHNLLINADCTSAEAVGTRFIANTVINGGITVSGEGTIIKDNLVIGGGISLQTGRHTVENNLILGQGKAGVVSRGAGNVIANLPERAAIDCSEPVEILDFLNRLVVAGGQAVRAEPGMTIATLAKSGTPEVYPLHVIPSEGGIDVTFGEWGRAGKLTKAWTESGGRKGLSVLHAVGDMSPGRPAVVSVDGKAWKRVDADKDGYVEFEYDGQWSEGGPLAFTVEHDAPIAVPENRSVREGEEAIIKILEKLRAPSIDVRTEGLVELKKMGPAACEALVGLFDCPDARLRWLAPATLASLGEQAVPGLKKALAEGGFQARWAAARALAGMGCAGLEALGGAIGQDSPVSVRLAAIWGLREMNDRRVVPTLMPHVLDPDARVSSRVLLALEHITGQKHGRDLGKWHNWWNGEIMPGDRGWKTWLEGLGEKMK